MKENWKHIFIYGSCPTIEELMQYHKGTIASGKRFAIENHLAGCEICNDILEGLANVKDPKTIDSAEKEISDKINAMLFANQNKRVPLLSYQRLALAASVLLVVSLGILLYQLNKPKPETVSQNLEEPKPITLYEKIKKPPAEKKETAPSTNTLKKEIQKDQEVSSSNAVIMDELALTPESKSAKDISDKNVSAARANGMTVEEEFAKTEALPQNEAKAARPAGISRKMAVETNDVSQFYEPRTITGIVKDENGEALPGVSVVVKGTYAGAVTDVNGRFKISIPDTSHVLQFSFIGFQSKEENIGKQKEVIVAMNASNMTLNEVVVSKYRVNNKTKKINSEIRMLENTIINTPQDKIALKKLAENYIELRHQSDALKTLDNFKSLTNDPEKGKQIDEVIQLVQENNYSKALRKLKKIDI